jgi:hypothetical protein
MNILLAVLDELHGMFVADIRLTIGIAVLIAIVAGLVSVLEVKPLAAGGVLLIGCIAVLIEAVVHKARSEVSR